MMTINLADNTERRVREEASRRGVDATELAVQLVEDGLSNWFAGAPHDAGIAMLLRRQREEATTDPVELERRRQLTEELLKSLDRHPDDVR